MTLIILVMLIALTISSALAYKTLIFLTSKIPTYDAAHGSYFHFIVNILHSQATKPGDLSISKGGLTSKELTNIIVSDSNILIFHTNEPALKENAESVTCPNIFNQYHFIKEG